MLPIFSGMMMVNPWYPAPDLSSQESEYRAMTDLSFTTFYAGWDRYQHLLVRAIAPLTREQLALRSALHQWPIGMIATHVVATRVWWFLWMNEEHPDLAPLAHWDEKGHPVREAIELVDGLERTWKMSQEALARRTPAGLRQQFSSPFMRAEEQKTSPRYSRQWIIFHVLSHEMHHGGEFSLTLGMYGFPTLYDGDDHE